MDIISQCENFMRLRITELRLMNNVSEHKMSLDLGKSGSYIRGISNGISLPSMREFFNICNYFDVSPEEFFAPMQKAQKTRTLLMNEILKMDDAGLEKVFTFIQWIQ